MPKSGRGSAEKQGESGDGVGGGGVGNVISPVNRRLRYACGFRLAVLCGSALLVAFFTLLQYVLNLKLKHEVLFFFIKVVFKSRIL